MKPIVLIALIVVVGNGMAAAQMVDTLGPHVNSHRGCRACHTPHTRASDGQDAGTLKPGAAGVNLWGENTVALPAAAEAEYVQLPLAASRNPEQRGVLICLSCHDGNYAPAAMMKNETYETMPESYGDLQHPPTLLDRAGVSTGHDLSNHPVGLDARMRCGGALGWDCTENQDGDIVMGGRHSSRFAGHYGYFVKPRSYDKAPVVVCTTCHNPHVSNVVKVVEKSKSDLFRSGTYATRYFLRAPYDTGASQEAGKEAAQFCRQCHADKSNEMNGSPTGSVL